MAAGDLTFEVAWLRAGGFVLAESPDVVGVSEIVCHDLSQAVKRAAWQLYSGSRVPPASATGFVVKVKRG